MSPWELCRQTRPIYRLCDTVRNGSRYNMGSYFLVDWVLFLFISCSYSFSFGTPRLVIRKNIIFLLFISWFVTATSVTFSSSLSCHSQVSTTCLHQLEEKIIFFSFFSWAILAKKEQIKMTQFEWRALLLLRTFSACSFVCGIGEEYSIRRTNDAPRFQSTTNKLLFGVHHKTSCYLCHFFTCCFPLSSRRKAAGWRWRRSDGWEIPHGERNRENKPS